MIQYEMEEARGSFSPLDPEPGGYDQRVLAQKYVLPFTS